MLSIAFLVASVLIKSNTWIKFNAKASADFSSNLAEDDLNSPDPASIPHSRRKRVPKMIRILFKIIKPRPFISLSGNISKGNVCLDALRAADQHQHLRRCKEQSIESVIEPLLFHATFQARLCQRRQFIQRLIFNQFPSGNVEQSTARPGGEIYHH